MVMKKTLVCACLLLVSGWALAEKTADKKLEPVPSPPEIPDAVQSGQPIEPEVTIIHKKEATIEEYRVNGNLYMVKVTPKVGPPYYLLDMDGDGSMETRRRGIRDDMSVPQWVLFSW
jgi:hypothetical protein